MKFLLIIPSMSFKAFVGQCVAPCSLNVSCHSGVFRLARKTYIGWCCRVGLQTLPSLYYSLHKPMWVPVITKDSVEGKLAK